MSPALKTLAFLGAGLAAALAVATWRGASAPELGAFGPDADPLAERVAALERELLRESALRRELAAEVDRLRVRLEEAGGLGFSAGGVITGDDIAGDERFADTLRDERRTPDERADDSRDPDGGDRFRGRPIRERLEQQRLERLVAAGFSVDRIEWIDRRTEELRMEALEAQYETARGGEPRDPAATLSVSDRLRAELGDAEYERYLEALGRQTRIGVRQVLASSPAERAGLLPGDEIVAYDGRRVFDSDDLNRLTLEGAPGETVVLEVLRDGQPMQLYVPRGPIGIVGGRRGR